MQYEISLAIIPSRKRTEMAIKFLLGQQGVDLPINIYFCKKIDRIDKEFKKEDVPYWDHEKVTVHEVEDLGPITKMWYQTKKPNIATIIADDDIIYSLNWARHLIDSYEDCANPVCIYGKSFANEKRIYTENVHHRWDKVKNPERAGILTHGHGAIYPNNIFGDDFYEGYDGNSEMRFNDDLYVSAYFSKNDIPVMVYPNKTVRLTYTGHNDPSRLWATNKEGRNDRITKMLQWQ